MNRLQLATLLSWSGNDGLRGRKRMQKIVYLLQSAGCPLDCEFILHHYGPYSRDLADVCDEMVSANLIDENNDSYRYDYQLTQNTRELLNEIDNRHLEPFKKLGQTLIKENIWSLELGSTIVFFMSKDENKDWNKAFEKACEFKKVDKSNQNEENHQLALELAKRVYEYNKRNEV